MMQRRYAAILLGFLLILAASALFVPKTSRETLAETVWAHTHLAPLATMLAPRDAALRFTIGNYYFGNGAYDLQKAHDAYQGALVLDPEMVGPHYQLARIDFIRSDFFFALKEINTEIELHPDFKRSYYVRGLINGYSGKLKDAESDFTTFLAWKPDS